MKFNVKKFNFLSLFKPCLIAILTIILLGGLIFGIFGLNRGFDFTGGTQLIVDFPYDKTIQTEEGLKNASSKISNILKENGVKINSFQVQGEHSEKCFVITFKTTDKDTVYNIRLAINEEFNSSTTYTQLAEDAKYKILDDKNFNLYDITRKTSNIDGFILPNTVLTTVATLLFALVVCMVYALFRLKLAGALSIVFSGAVSVLLTIAFVALTRIEVNTYFFVAFGLIEFVSLFTTVDMMFSLKQKLKDPLLTDKTNEQLADMVIKEHLTKNTIIYASAVVVSIIIGVVGVLNVLKLGFVAFIGLIVSFAINVFVVPALWAMMNKKRNLIKPTIVAAEVVETNDTDEDAEVIEVKEEK